MKPTISKRFSLPAVFLGLCGMVFFLSLSVTLTLNARFLYYMDIDALAADTGMKAAEIRENYDALIDYNSITGPEILTFPTLPMSETGRVHFEEVKVLFVGLEYACIVSGLLFAAGAVWLLKKKKDPRFLFYAWLFGTVIPALAALLAAVNWDWFFTAFHHVMFRNNYWIFDASTDPIILLLPDTYFLKCLVVIIVLMLLFVQGCGLLYRRLRPRRNPA